MFLLSCRKEWVHRCPQVHRCQNGATSLAVQWLRLPASTAGGTGLIPDPGIKDSTCCIAKKIKIVKVYACIYVNTTQHNEYRSPASVPTPLSLRPNKYSVSP